MPDTPPPSPQPEFPEPVQAVLTQNGINGDALFSVKTDLDSSGQFGERYLVATPQRLVVIANNGSAKLEREIPLADIAGTESKGLSGASTLEIRVKTGSSEKVVEILRGSGARARELGHAARQIEHLRTHGTLQEDEGGDNKKRVCPTCGRPLAPNTSVCNFCVNRWATLKRIYQYLKPYYNLVIGNGALQVLSIGLDFVAPVATKMLIDQVFPPAAPKGSAVVTTVHTYAESLHILTWLVLAVVGSSALSSVFGVLRGRTTAMLGAYVLHDIRAELYAHLQRLSVAFYDKREVGAVMSRVQSDVGMLQNFLLDGAENIVIAALTITIVVGLMFYHSPLLAIGVLMPVPFVVYGTNNYWRGLMKLWRRVWQQNSALGARLADALGGVRVVRAFGAETREVDHFVGRSASLRDATTRVERKAAAFYPVMGFIMGLGLPITWYFGGLQVLNGSVSFGTLFLFTILLARLYGPVQQLTRLVNSTTRALTAAERVFEVLDTEPEVSDKAETVTLDRIRGEVEFRHVVFGYERHRPVLNDISLHVQPGEMIGLVGHSGAGKSTIMNLLLRFYDVNEGGVFVDGHDVRTIRREDLRRNVGVVLQESYLFHGTVYDNIAYGRPEATPAEVMAAAKAAYAHDFIVSFADGYDTLVGERGTRLSGGERQRIAIARAILHNPQILILDEATASVDTQTEQQIQKALANLIEGRTTFAIAHRLSTLRHASRLVVIEKGRIAEIGTHDELLAKRGVFSKLVEAQKAMNEIHTVGG